MSLKELESTLASFVEAFKNSLNSSPQYSERMELRKKWPGLKTGSYALEAYDRACKILGYVPEPTLCGLLIEELKPDKLYSLQDLSKAWETDVYRAEAYLIIAQIGLILAPFGKDYWYLVDRNEYQDPRAMEPAFKSEIWS